MLLLTLTTLLLEHHGVKFSKALLSRIWRWGDLEPRRRYVVEGRSLLERATNMEIERKYCWGVVVEHWLHNAEVFGHYVIMNSYVSCMYIQADWYRLCNANQRTTGHSLGPESSFLFLGLC